MTNREFADRMGCNRTTASRYRNGKRRMLPDQLMKLAEQFNLDAGELLKVHSQGHEAFGTFMRQHIFERVTH